MAAKLKADDSIIQHELESLQLALVYTLIQFTKILNANGVEDTYINNFNLVTYYRLLFVVVF